MPKLKTIEQPLPLAKMAYQSLRDSILTGDLKPGEIYNEMALAKELGISRTPVREALLELSAQGLVRFLPRRGVMVHAPTRRDIEEIFEVREAVELLAVEKAAQAPQHHDLSGLVEAVEAQERALRQGDFLAFMEADRIFHTAFSELTRNRRLVALIENIRDLMQLVGYHALAVEGRAREVIAEHRRVLEAVKAGKPGAARLAMKEHLTRSKAAVDRAGSAAAPPEKQRQGA